jgi:germination protein YpeB
MVQVIVSLDSGNIAAYDANKFLLSHTQRTLPEPKISEQEARARVNKNLNIEEVRLALIPLDNLQEKLTYEVKGKIDEDTYYVYINAETGFQEKILLIVETPQGSRSL